MQENLETAILDALYDFFDSHLGSPQMTFGELYGAIGVSLDDEENVRKVLFQLYCLQGKKWVEYQSFEDGLGGSVEITSAGIKVVEDRRKIIASTSVDRSVNDSYGAAQEPTDLFPGPLPIVPETVVVPAGFFWMGSHPYDPEARENEKPRRKLSLPEYRIGRYPVTNVEYACFVHDTGQPPPNYWDRGKVPPNLEDHPVVNVSYDDAEAYCHWLSRVTRHIYRLPTEKEWEKAARGIFPEERRYPWGDECQLDSCNTCELGREGTTSVHQFEQINQSPFGIVDMAGNVWEWTASWYERYPGSKHDTVKYGQSYRVVRGGSWRSHREDARISCRGRYEPDALRLYLGFRVTSEADAQAVGTAS